MRKSEQPGKVPDTFQPPTGINIPGIGTFPGPVEGVPTRRKFWRRSDKTPHPGGYEQPNVGLVPNDPGPSHTTEALSLLRNEYRAPLIIVSSLAVSIASKGLDPEAAVIAAGALVYSALTPTKEATALTSSEPPVNENQTARSKFPGKRVRSWMHRQDNPPTLFRRAADGMGVLVIAQAVEPAVSSRYPLAGAVIEAVKYATIAGSMGALLRVKRSAKNSPDVITKPVTPEKPRKFRIRGTREKETGNNQSNNKL